MAPPAGFNSTMQLPKRQLNKITVLVEFVIYGGLQTQSVYRNSYLTIATFFCKTSTLCNIKKAESTDRRAASASGNEVLPPSFIKKYREA